MIIELLFCLNIIFLLPILGYKLTYDVWALCWKYETPDAACFSELHTAPHWLPPKAACLIEQQLGESRVIDTHYVVSTNKICYIKDKIPCINCHHPS